MKQIAPILVLCLFLLLFTNTLKGQVSGNVPDGTNKFQLIPPLRGINASKPDSVGVEVGRDIVIVPGPNSLDGDNLADIVTTDYERGGAIHVFEQVSRNSLQFQLVFSSDSIKGSATALRGTGSANASPRTVVVGDMDGNGRKEIIFPVGRVPADTGRGIYFYEWDGATDNKYNPVYKLRPEAIDTLFNTTNFGRQEGSGLIADDVDGDGKVELLVGSRDFGGPANRFMYILQVQSGTFAGKNAVVGLEYEYKDFQYVNDDGILPDSSDGYIPFGMEVGDFDGDGKKEIMVLGWADNASGSGLGFIDIPGPNTYTEGSVIPIVPFGGPNQFNVSGNPATVPIAPGTNIPFILLEPIDGSPRRLVALDGVSDVGFVGSSNLKRVWSGVGSWGGLSWGDQDHGISKDGFEIYIPNGRRVASLEYKGTGSPADSTSFVLKDSLFNLLQVFKSSGGAITDIVTFDGMDLNGNGSREVVVNYKPSDVDTLLSGLPLKRGTYAFFVLEWGDSTTKVVTSVADEENLPLGYRLDQNYPNPFNPSTTIKFSLPKSSPVTLKIFDVTGREVRTLINNKNFDAGGFQVEWDGRNNEGRHVASGAYFYTMEAGSYTSTRKMVLLK